MPVPPLPTRPERRIAPSLWRDPDFVRLWVGQTASQFGAQASQVTLPLIAVVTLGVGAGQLGVLRAVQQVPVLLLSLFVGVWVDRWRVRSVMVLADFGRAVALAVIPVAYLLDRLGVPLVFVVGFVVGVFTVCFDVAYQASLVQLVERDQLAQGNSMLESSTSAAQIGGPAIGGGLISLISAPIAVVASSIFFIVSFASIGRIRRSQVVPEYDGPSTGLMRQIRAGLRLVAGDARLRAIGLASGCYLFFFAAVMTIYLLYLPRTLHLSGGAIGLVLAALGAGSLVGSLLSTRLPRRFGYGVVLVAGALISDGVLLCVPAVHGSGPVTVMLLVTINVVYGAFGQAVDVAVMAVRQAITPRDMQGRVVATIHFTGVGMTPLGSLLGGALAGVVGLRTGLLLAAAGMLLSPLCIALSPLTRLGKSLPQPNADRSGSPPIAPGTGRPSS